MLVSVNGRIENNVIVYAYAKEVVQVHHHRILGNATPYGNITSFFPVQIGKDTFCSSAISMHDIDMVSIAGQVIRINFTKSIGI